MLLYSVAIICTHEVCYFTKPFALLFCHSHHHSRPFKAKASAPKITEVISHLKKFDLWGRNVPAIKSPPAHMALPPLLGGSIESHFRMAAEELAEPWLSQARRLATSNVPPMPKEWIFEPGWTR